MKNKIAILLAAVFLLLSGCTAGQEDGHFSRQDPPAAETAAANRLQVVTTIFPPYDFARQIGGDNVEVTMLLKPGMESHSYEPTPADIIRIMESDVFLYAGGESDVWVETLLEANAQDTESYALLDWVDPLEEEKAEGMQVKGHEHAHAAEDGAVHLEEAEYDEHVWTSPKNAMVITEKIREVFCRKDPANAAVYTENAAVYLEKLKELDQAFLEVTQGAKRYTLIFGDRFPMLYFVKTYGLDFYAAFPGCSMETEPSAATIAYLTDKVKKEQIPVVFYLEMSNGRIAEAIAEASGAKTGVFYSGHAITAEDMEAGEDYLSLMYRNVEALKAALWE